MIYRVVFTPEAQDQIADQYHYLAKVASPAIALRYTESVISYCESLCTFPQRGNKRDDIRLGLRITHYKKRAVVAFDVDGKQVSIIGVFFGGQDYEAALQDDPNDDLLGH